MKEPTFWNLLLVGAVCIGYLAGFLTGGLLALDAGREKAVKAGMAEWAHDEHGRPEFKWIRTPEEKENGNATP